MVYFWAYIFFNNRAGSNSEKGKRERAPELYGCMDGTRGEMEIHTLWNEKDRTGVHDSLSHLLLCVLVGFARMDAINIKSKECRD